MASFTDAITQFNPYVAQLPVDAMVKVGMQKQAQYEDGVKKVQAQIDQVAGLDVLRNVDKNYLQSKLNELGGRLRFYAAGDFSNFQLVNSVAGMTKQISKDKFVQAAVSSAANHRKQMTDMEADKKKGTLTPDNEYYYNKQLNSYLESTDLKTEEGSPITFSGKYIPNFDVFKFAKETFDAVKPDGFSFDQVYITDANGNPKRDANGQPIYSPVMVRMEKEGIFPEKVKQTLGQIFSDPRVSQQLAISGQYNYRGLDENALSQKVLSQKADLMNSYDEKLKELAVQKNMGKNVQAEIDQIKLARDNANTTYDDYAKLAMENPDAVRGQLYKDDVNSRYTTMFGWMKKKEQQMENPGWNANFKLQQEANRVSEFAQRLHFDKQKHADEMRWKQIQYEQEERKINTEKGKGTVLDDASWDQGDQASSLDVLNKLETDYQDAASNFKASSNDFLWSTVFSGVGNNDKTLATLMERGMSRSAAISKMVSDGAKVAGKTEEEFIATWGSYGVKQYNKMSQKQRDKLPGLTDAYTAYSNAKTNFDGMVAVKKRIDDRAKRELGELANDINITGDVAERQPVLFGGKEYSVTRNQVYDMAVYLRGQRSSLGFLEGDAAKNASKEAYKRLQAAGLDKIADNMLNTHSAAKGMKGVFSIAGLFSPGSQDLITTAVRGTKAAIHDMMNPFDKISTIPLFGQIDRVYQKLNNEDYEKGLSRKADMVREVYGIRGNKKANLLTGDNETDKGTIFKLRSFAGAYTDGQKMNLSRDFDNFAKSISGDIGDMSVTANVYMDRAGGQQIEITSFDKEGERVGGMTIQPDEALRLGIDIDKIYEPKDVGILRNKINTKGGQTSDGNPAERSTYYEGDVQYDRSYFPAIQGSPYDVKANISYNNGVYYPFVYVSDGEKDNVRQLPGSDDLHKLTVSLKQMNSTLAQKILNDK